jgi:hypothetical protein
MDGTGGGETSASSANHSWRSCTTRRLNSAWLSSSPSSAKACLLMEPFTSQEAMM